MKTFLKSLLNEPFFWKSNRLRIAIIEPDIYPCVEEIRCGFLDETVKPFAPFYTFSMLNSQGSVSQVRQKIQEIIFGNYDLIFSIGPSCTLVVKAACDYYQKPIPLVFAGINDPVRLKLIQSPDRSGTHATGIISFDNNYSERLEHLLHILPDIKKVLIVYNPWEEEDSSASEKDTVIRYLADRNIESMTVSVWNKNEVANSIKSSLSQVKPDVIFTLCDNVIMGAMKDIAACAREYQVPLYVSDLGSVKMGAALGCGHVGANIGIESSKIAQKILNDRYTPENLPIFYYKKPYRLLLNSMAMYAQGLNLGEEAINWILQHGDII